VCHFVSLPFRERHNDTPVLDTRFVTLQPKEETMDGEIRTAYSGTGGLRE